MKLETNFIDQIKGRFKQLRFDSRSDAYVFLVCLGISIFIWFLIVLSKESSTTLEYPIHYNNIPKDMVLVNNPDSILVFRIESGGFELLTLKYLSRRKPIDVNLRNLNLQKQNGYYTSALSTSQISSNILKDHNFSEELVSISPENIYFQFERLAGKMVQVVPNLNFSFERQFRLMDSLIIFPDSVKLVGSANQLSTIDQLETELSTVNAVNSDGTIKCQIKNPLSDDQINIIPSVVEISYKVEKFTESTIEIPIQANQGVNAKFFPATAQVTFLVSLTDFSRVNEDMFSIVGEIPENHSLNTVKIVSVSSPSFVEIIHINPAEVEYLILKE